MTRRKLGIGAAATVVIALMTAGIASRNDPAIRDSPTAATDQRSNTTQRSTESTQEPTRQPKIDVRVAPTVEVTFGNIEDWEGRPLTAYIGQQTPLLPDRIAFLQNLATQYGSKSTVARQGTLELFDREINPAWAYPVWAIALDPEAAAELLGPDVGNALQRGELVLNRTAATLRKAEAGTSITLAGWDDPIRSLSAPVGVIVDDERTADAEMLLSTATADALGLTRIWRVIAWGGDAKAVARDAAATVGTRYITRSWTPKSVDSVLSPAELKAELGEFAILRRLGTDPSANGSSVDSDPGWVERNIVRANIPIIGPINCHRKLIKPLQAVFEELEQAGVAALIDVADTRRAGGCWNPRLIRSANGISGRNISRHSWGAALDINPSTNAYGATPTIDERVVDVFRRHGFAWGGTFPIADGMHFEFIGKPRVTGEPLPPGTSTTTSTSTTSTTSTTSSTSTTTTSTTSTLPLSSTSTSTAATIATTSKVPSPTSVRPVASTTLPPTATTPTPPTPTTVVPAPPPTSSAPTLPPAASTIPEVPTTIPPAP